jgi:hypothetical protein
VQFESNFYLPSISGFASPVAPYDPIAAKVGETPFGSSFTFSPSGFVWFAVFLGLAKSKGYLIFKKTFTVLTP